VFLAPVGQADVTKLVIAPASHVVAAFGLIYKNSTLGTPFPLLEVILKI